jgi:signal transduction histidine kinase
MNRRSLTFRLVSWYCGLLLVLGVAFAAYTYTGFSRYLRETLQATLTTRAEVTWDVARTALDDRDRLTALMEQRFAPEAHDRFTRITVDGEQHYLSGPPVEHRFDPAIVAPLAEASPTGLRHISGLWIYSLRRTTPDGRQVTIETGQAGDAMATAESGLIKTLLIGLPLLLVITGLGGYVLVRRAFTPVAAMINVAEALTFNSPHNRLPLAGTSDQLDELGHALNRMLERLDNAYQHASRFSADAAHELRTPLTIMRGEIEFVAAAKDLSPEIQAALESALEETLRLGHIVDSLMALSRLDSIAGKREHWPVDLAALAAETMDQMQLLAEEKEITLSLLVARQASTPVLAMGDRDRLKQVLVNLLDNAIKYTEVGGRVTVDIDVDGDRVLLKVTDTGIGIPTSLHSDVFERFFRVATDRGPSGAGLGLAIVKSICLAHGGQVTLDSSPGVGSSFCVELPLARPESPTRQPRPEPTSAKPVPTT